jgi:hypothetical protein
MARSGSGLESARYIAGRAGDRQLAGPMHLVQPLLKRPLRRQFEAACERLKTLLEDRPDR